MDPLKSIEHQTVEDLAYRTLQQAILSGELPGGLRLVQTELARKLGTSRIPVRDALRRLEADGLVTSNARGGYQVTPFHPTDAREIYALREILEPFAASVAVPRLSEDHLDRLGSLTRTLEDAANTMNAHLYVEANKRLHFALYELSDMPRLVRMIATLWSGRPPLTPLQNEDQMAQSVAEHYALLEVLQRRDAERVAALLRIHIRRSGEQLLARLQGAPAGDH